MCLRPGNGRATCRQPRDLAELGNMFIYLLEGFFRDYIPLFSPNLQQASVEEGRIDYSYTVASNLHRQILQYVMGPSATVHRPD